MNKSYPILLIVVALLATSGCVDRAAQKQGVETQKVVSDPSTAVRVEAAKTMDVPNVVQLTGSVKTGDDMQVSSKASGRIAEVFVKEGDLVKPGQQVARMEGTEAYARLSAAQAVVAQNVAALQESQTDAASAPTRSSAGERGAQARVNAAKQVLAKLQNGSRPEEKRQAQANLDRTKSDLDFAQKNYDRNKMLFDQGAISASDLETAQNRLDTAKSAYEAQQQAFSLVQNPTRAEDIAQAEQQIQSALEDLKNAQATKKNDPIYAQRVAGNRAQVKNAQDQVALAQQAVRDLTITAPKGGKVVGSPLQAGSVVTPGQSIARLVNLRDVYFEAESPENTVTKIHPGEEARISISAIADTAFIGYVQSVDAIASSTGRLYNVRINFKDSSDFLRSNMFGTANIQINLEQGATTVPSIAVVSRDSTTYVYVVEGDKAKKKLVTVGATAGERVVVTGISPGDKVVVRGQDTLVDGALVKVDTSSAPTTANSTATGA